MLRAIIIDIMPPGCTAASHRPAGILPEVEVIGDAGGVVSGARLIKEQKPICSFWTVQLKDGTGFDLLESCPTRLDFQVIFTTVWPRPYHHRRFSATPPSTTCSNRSTRASGSGQKAAQLVVKDKRTTQYAARRGETTRCAQAYCAACQEKYR